jgi:hypothetical protein
MSYLQSSVHELAWSDTVAATLTVGFFAAVAARRLCRRKAARTKL